MFHLAIPNIDLNHCGILVEIYYIWMSDTENTFLREILIILGIRSAVIDLNEW